MKSWPDHSPSGNQKRILARSREAVPQATEWQRIGDYRCGCGFAGRMPMEQ